MLNLKERSLVSRLSFKSRLGLSESAGVDKVSSVEPFYQNVYTSFKKSVLPLLFDLNDVYKCKQGDFDVMKNELQEVIIDLVWIIMMRNHDDIQIASFDSDQWFEESMRVLENMLNKDFLAKVVRLVEDMFMDIGQFEIAGPDFSRNESTLESAETDLGSEDQKQFGIEKKLWLEPLLKNLREKCVAMYFLIYSKSDQDMPTEDQFSFDISKTQKQIKENSLKVLLRYFAFIDKECQTSSERRNDNSF